MAITKERLSELVGQQVQLREKKNELLSVLGLVVTAGAVIVGINLLVKGLKGKEIRR